MVNKCSTIHGSKKTLYYIVVLPMRPNVYGTSGPISGGVTNQNCRVVFRSPTS